MLHHRQGSINADPKIFNITPCILVPRFPSWASCSSKAHPEQVEMKHQSRQTTLIYVKCRCYTCNRLSWLEQRYFPVHCDINMSWQMVSCIPHNQHFRSWFQTFAGKISLYLHTKKKITAKCNLLVHYGYRQLITEYLISDMMKNYRLGAARRDTCEKNQKTLPQPFSVPIWNAHLFWLQAMLCSDPKHLWGDSSSWN